MRIPNFPGRYLSSHQANCSFCNEPTMQEVRACEGDTEGTFCRKCGRLIRLVHLTDERTGKCQTKE